MLKKTKKEETLEDIVVGATGKSIAQSVYELWSDDWLKKAFKNTEKPPKGSTHEWVTYGGEDAKED